MVNFAKWIGAILGGVLCWPLGIGEQMGNCGPILVVLGFFAGTVIDSFELYIFSKPEAKVTMGDFAVSLLGLIAAVMNTGKPGTKPVQEYAKHFLKQNFGEKEAVEAHIFLNRMLKKKIPLENDCAQIRNNLDYSSRLQLTHFLYNLANVDGHVTDAEQNMLNLISRGLRVSISEKRSVGSVFVQEDSIVAAYGILGVHRAASVIDIKKAYRNLAIKYHPDKVAYLGEDLRKAANERFQQLTRAYEIVKRDRHFT